jgi:hypothetical protein
MNYKWAIDEKDIQRVRSFVQSHENNLFVQKRIERNLTGPPPEFSKTYFWKTMVDCRLTSQQRVGPNSSVSRFINSLNYLLSYDICLGKEELDKFVEQTLTKFGGIRFAKTIGEHVQHNMRWLEDNGWSVVGIFAEKLLECRREEPNPKHISTERAAAETMMKHLKGFGPKQSRNLWQSMGYTRFETPLDSRITKWLNRSGFPIKLTSGALSEPNYYNFVMDGFQALCDASGIHPCVLDGVIFASYDEEWTIDQLAY